MSELQSKGLEFDFWERAHSLGLFICQHIRRKDWCSYYRKQNRESLVLYNL